MKKIIFACVHNAGRSQMAAAFFNQLADTTRAHAVSAGTQPANHVHPVVLAAMKRVGIDLTDAIPQLLTDELAREANMLITMGCGEACPFIVGLERDDWALADPKGKSDAEVTAIRDEIQQRVVRLLSMLGALKN